MRNALKLLSAAALAAGTVATSAPAAHAIKCPPGTRLRTIWVTEDRSVTVCVPYQHCDPASCDYAVLP